MTSKSRSHPALNRRRTLILPLDTNKLVHQPANVRPVLGPDVLGLGKAGLKLAGDVIDAVDEDFGGAAPDNDAFDGFVEVGEPVCRCE